jgi:hypothetical protein
MRGAIGYKPPPHAEINALAEKARSGNKSAREKITKDVLMPIAEKATRAHGVPDQFIEDAVQEALIAALSTLDKNWNPSKGNFLPHVERRISGVKGVGGAIEDFMRKNATEAFHGLAGRGRDPAGKPITVDSLNPEASVDHETGKTDADLEPTYVDAGQTPRGLAGDPGLEMMRLHEDAAENAAFEREKSLRALRDDERKQDKARKRSVAGLKKQLAKAPRNETAPPAGLETSAKEIARRKMLADALRGNSRALPRKR